MQMKDAWNDGYIGTYGLDHYVVGYHYYQNWMAFKYDSLHSYAKNILPAVESDTNFAMKNSNTNFRYNMVSGLIIMFWALFFAISCISFMHL